MPRRKRPGDEEPQEHPYEFIERYERKWPADEFNDLSIELTCFLEGLTPEEGGLGKAEHFWKACAFLWPEDGPMPFIRNPWSERMIESACEWQYLSVSGPGNCGKTVTYAVWAIVNWLADPVGTAVLVTSTSIKESRKRIWGAIVDYWNAIEGAPGKLADSLGIIRYVNPSTGVKGSDRSSISVVSGEKRHETKSIGKLIGIHNRRIIIIGDELPELSPAILEAVKTNVSKNPWFQLVGIGNPNSIFDPHGVLSTPKNGWKSVTPNDEEWETELGYAIRFDGERSPNILAGRVIYEWLPTIEDKEESIKKNGENSLGHWRMFRGFWCPEGASHGIYSEPEIALYGGIDKFVPWGFTPTAVGACDPDFTHDGDGAVAIFGEFGSTTTGLVTLLYTDAVLIAEDRNDPTPRTTQIALRYMRECKKRGVLPQNAGYDHTGAGIPFGDRLSEVWDTTEVCRVQFGGAASEILVGTVGALPASKRFFDRVSELWFVGRDFLASGQLKGISPDLAKQMIARRTHEGGTVKRDGYTLERVESKKQMRKRTGFSPNLADAAFILLDVCRTRFKFRAITSRMVSAVETKRWNRFVRRNDESEFASGRSLPTTLAEDREYDRLNRRSRGGAIFEDDERDLEQML